MGDTDHSCYFLNSVVLLSTDATCCCTELTADVAVNRACDPELESNMIASVDQADMKGHSKNVISNFV